MQGPIDHRFSTDFKEGRRDPWMADLVQILKGERRDPRTAGSVQILKREHWDPRTADLVRILQGDLWTAESVQVFEGRLLVVGGHKRWRNRKNAIGHICFVTAAL